jgi:hypothetical protein
MMQMSQVLEYEHKTSLPQTRTSRRQSGIEHFRRGLLGFATLNQTVSALKGDVPGGSLERLGEPSRYLTAVWNAPMSGPRHPLCEG